MRRFEVTAIPMPRIGGTSSTLGDFSSLPKARKQRLGGTDVFHGSFDVIANRRKEEDLVRKTLYHPIGGFCAWTFDRIFIVSCRQHPTEEEYTFLLRSWTTSLNV